MQFRKHLIQMAAGAVSAVMLLSSACTTALAADNTPIGYIEAVPGTVTGADVTSDPNYLIYKGYLEEENGVVSALYNGLTTPGQRSTSVTTPSRRKTFLPYCR